MTVAANLTADLAAANLGVPVLAPGSVAVELPAVVVVPADDTLGEGGRFIVHGYDVTVMVPRDSTVERLDELETLAAAVVVALIETGHAIGTRLRYVGGDAEDVHYLARVIPVAAPGAVIC